MTIVEKSDKSLTICLDPFHLNKTVKREFYQMPTIEEISSKLTGAKFFTLLGAAQGVGDFIHQMYCCCLYKQRG